MNHILPLPTIWQKLIFRYSDLQQPKIKPECSLIENLPIAKWNKELKGEYSIFSSKQIVLWEGTFNTQSRILMTYPPEISSSHFYLLYFKSTNHLNVRFNVNLPIDEQLLNAQSGFGSIIWASNVGLELMIPSNTEVIFQLHVIPKNTLTDYLKRPINITERKIAVFTESNVPLFYFSKDVPNFLDATTLIKKSSNNQQRREAILSRIIEYFSSNNEQTKGKLSLWNLQVILKIEQQICQIPADEKPNLVQIGQLFEYFPKNTATLFKQILGKSIQAYHCGIHMEYACWLLETQQLSIIEVSEQLDFKSKKTFSYMFKSHYLVNPKLYKVKS
jgi:AraC-like DNA-binding protein